MRDAGPPPPTSARVQNISAYEGQEAFVTVLESDGDDWTSAVVSSTSPSLEVVSQACGASLCGVVVRVIDTMRNTGQAIPAPLDAAQAYLRVDAPAGPRQGLLRVFPLDALTAVGETDVSGVYFASSVRGDAGSVLRGMGSAPVRWVIFGSATIDTFDVGAGAAAPGPGGGAGGSAGSSAPGATGGMAASGMVGAGGGGSLEEGGLGAMQTVGAPASDLTCLTDLFAPSCGGGGGGGATGPGGAGGGALSILALGSLELGAVRAAGGDAAVGGGGGGGGGLVHLAATRLASAPSFELAGGAGDGTGGAGGGGGARVDGEAGSSVIRGPRIDVDPSALLSRAGSLAIAGDAAPDREIRIERVTSTGATEVGTGRSDPTTGVFSVDVALEPGLNRLRVVQLEADGGELRAFNGNHFELERRDSMTGQLPIGGLLDVAFIP